MYWAVICTKARPISRRRRRERRGQRRCTYVCEWCVRTRQREGLESLLTFNMLCRLRKRQGISASISRRLMPERACFAMLPLLKLQGMSFQNAVTFVRPHTGSGAPPPAGLTVFLQERGVLRRCFFRRDRVECAWGRISVERHAEQSFCPVRVRNDTAVFSLSVQEKDGRKNCFADEDGEGSRFGVCLHHATSPEKTFLTLFVRQNRRLNEGSQSHRNVNGDRPTDAAT